jgi:hypothetical protein
MPGPYEYQQITKQGAAVLAIKTGEGESLPKRSRAALMASAIELGDEIEPGHRNFGIRKLSDPANVMFMPNKQTDEFAPRGGYASWTNIAPSLLNHTEDEKVNQYIPLLDATKPNEDDFEKMELSVEAAQYGKRIPDDILAGVLESTGHEEHTPVALLSGGPLVADHRGPHANDMSRYMFDVNTEGKLDPERRAGLHTAFNVVEWVDAFCGGGGTASSFAEFPWQIALQFTKSESENTGFGAVFHSDGLGVLSAEAQGYSRYGAPKHRIGTSRDGQIRREQFDIDYGIFGDGTDIWSAPMHFQRKIWIQGGKGPFITNPELRMRLDMKHPHMCGDRVGMWDWIDYTMLKPYNPSPPTVPPEDPPTGPPPSPPTVPPDEPPVPPAGPPPEGPPPEDVPPPKGPITGDPPKKKPEEPPEIYYVLWSPPDPNSPKIEVPYPPGSTFEPSPDDGMGTVGPSKYGNQSPTAATPAELESPSLYLHPVPNGPDAFSTAGVMPPESVDNGQQEQDAYWMLHHGFDELGWNEQPLTAHGLAGAQYTSDTPNTTGNGPRWRPVVSEYGTYHYANGRFTRDRANVGPGHFTFASSPVQLHHLYTGYNTEFPSAFPNFSLGVFAAEDDNGLIADGRFGVGSRVPDSPWIARGQEFRLGFTGAAGNSEPDLHLFPKSNTAGDGLPTGGATFYVHEDFNVAGDTTINGNLAVSGSFPTTPHPDPHLLSDGSSGAPTYSFSDAARMGMWRDVDPDDLVLNDGNGDDQVRITTDGLELLNPLAVDQGGTGATTAAGARTNLGAQTSDATLTAFAALTIAANSLTIGTGADAFSQTTFAANTFPGRSSSGNLVAKTITDTAFSILDDADVDAVLTTLVNGATARTPILTSKLAGYLASASDGGSFTPQQILNLTAALGENTAPDVQADSLLLYDGGSAIAQRAFPFNIGVPLLRVRTTAQTVTSDNSLNNDNALTVSAIGTGNYMIEFLLLVTSGATPDFQFDFAGGTATFSTFTGSWEQHDGGNSGAFTANNAAQAVVAASWPKYIHVRIGAVCNGAGSFTLRHAQNTSDGGTAAGLSIGSWMRITRVA